MCKTLLIDCLCVVALFSSAAFASEPDGGYWPQFRGPDGGGVSTAQNVPVDFGLDRGLKWQTPIRGKGWSSPVASDGRIWLTTALTTEATQAEKDARLANVQMPKMKDVAGSLELRAVCLDLETGKIVRDISLASFAEPEPIHPLNSYASPTPVIDGDRVFCHFGAYGTWCLDAKTADIIWTNRLVIDHSVGPGGSPAIVANNLILVCDGIDVQFVAALDKMTGQEVWRTARPTMRATNGEFQKAYSTPLILDVAGVTQAIIPGAQWLVSYDPKTGQELWRADHGNGFSLSTTPIFVPPADAGNDSGLVIFTTGYGQTEVVAVRPDGQGDVTLSHIQWRTDRSVPAKPSLVAAGELIYMIDDNGVLSCLRASDAEVVFRQRVPGNYSASPLLVGGHIYFSNQEGEVTVVKQSDEYEEVAKIQLDGRLMASPAVVGSDLLFRSEASLMRFSVEPTQK